MPASMYLDFRQHHKGLDNLNSEVATDSALRTVGFNGKKIHLLRHGQAIHKSCPARVPIPRSSLTDQGIAEARTVSLDFQPDLVICSPMNRTINTALAVLPDLSQSAITVEIWPDMREAHDAICNKGWDYEDHSHDAATRRAERVRTVLAERSEQNILLVGHRGFIDYLVAGPQFANCELRSYRFGPDNTLVKIS
ncbi:histidine phosphatase superfamily [Mycena olivaceomarginata]|nr:histidine phosphatase superfamily [Mycena olivaceomarginata]